MSAPFFATICSPCRAPFFTATLMSGSTRSRRPSVVWTISTTRRAARRSSTLSDFSGSVDLIARRRGWTADRERLFQSFFDGYARALINPAYLPADPEVVKRVRARPARTQDEFSPGVSP